MPLFFKDSSASDLFLSAINDKPELKPSTGSEWHLGNVEFIDNLSGSFAVGRTTKTTVEKYDKESGDFIDEVDDSGPYTRVIFDCRIGLLGIAKKSKLAPDAATVAKKIRSLFVETETVINAGVDVRIDFIPDPVDFIERLRLAFAITKFKATFTGPNPIDADELFQKPLSVYAQKMGADKGILEVQGKSLDESTAEMVAKSTAATGNTASARIITESGKKSVPIQMKGGAVVISVEEEAAPEEVLAQMRDKYENIRG